MATREQRRDPGKERAESRAGARRRARVTALIITAGAILAVAAIALILVLREQGAGAPASGSAGEPSGASSATRPETGQAAARSAAPASATAGESDLEKAADAVGFQVTTGADIGVIENLPAETTLLPPSRTLLPVGAVAPDFTLRTPEGATVRLSDYRGKTVLLEFFATWCPHCQAEAPHLLAMYQSMPTSRIAFLAVNGDSEDAASVHAFGRHFGLPWPELLDPGSPPGSFSQQGGIGPVSRAYGLSLFPTFYIIDAKGRIAWRGDREQPDGLLRARLLDVSGS